MEEKNGKLVSVVFGKTEFAESANIGVSAAINEAYTSPMQHMQVSHVGDNIVLRMDDIWICWKADESC